MPDDVVVVFGAVAILCAESAGRIALVAFVFILSDIGFGCKCRVFGLLK